MLQSRRVTVWVSVMEEGSVGAGDLRSLGEVEGATLASDAIRAQRATLVKEVMDSFMVDGGGRFEDEVFCSLWVNLVSFAVDVMTWVPRTLGCREDAFLYSFLDIFTTQVMPDVATQRYNKEADSKNTKDRS